MNGWGGNEPFSFLRKLLRKVHGFSFFEQVSTTSSIITRDPKAAKREISTALIITGLVCDYSHKGAHVAVGWDRKCPSQGIVLYVVPIETGHQQFPLDHAEGALNSLFPTRSQLGASTDSPIKSFQHACCSSNSVFTPSHVNFNGGLGA
jgi:hypothetical protein